MPYVFEHDSPALVANLAGNAGEFAAGLQLDQSAQQWTHLAQQAAAQQAAEARQQAQLMMQQNYHNQQIGLGQQRIGLGYDRLGQADEHFQQGQDDKFELENLRQLGSAGRLDIRGQQRLEQLEQQAAAAAQRQQTGIEAASARQQTGIDASTERMRENNDVRVAEGEKNRTAAGERQRIGIEARAKPAIGPFQQFKAAESAWKVDVAKLRQQMGMANSARLNTNIPAAAREAGERDYRNALESLNWYMQNRPQISDFQDGAGGDYGDSGAAGAAGAPGSFAQPAAQQSRDGTLPTVAPEHTSHLQPTPLFIAKALYSEARIHTNGEPQAARQMVENWLVGGGFDPYKIAPEGLQAA